jgi:hypothetical protein
MTELSREARELIGKARPAERADASAKKRVRAALAVHLALPPTAPPPAGPMATGTVGAAGSAAKLVLICSLTAAGAVGTTAVIKHRHSAEHGSSSQRIARMAEPLPAQIAQPKLSVPDTHVVVPPASVPSGPVFRGSLRAEAPVPAVHLSLRKQSVARESTSQGLKPPPLSATPAKVQADIPPSPRAFSPPPWDMPDSTRHQPQPSQPSFPVERQLDDVAPIAGPTTHVTPLVTMKPTKTGCSAKSELRLLSAAQIALREGHGEQALALLDQHAASCPSATFGEERGAARVLALCLLHRERQALAEAAQLATQAPRSPQLARLRSSCAAAAVILSEKDRNEP